MSTCWPCHALPSKQYLCASDIVFMALPVLMIVLSESRGEHSVARVDGPYVKLRSLQSTSMRASTGKVWFHAGVVWRLLCTRIVTQCHVTSDRFGRLCIWSAMQGHARGVWVDAATCSYSALDPGRYPSWLRRSRLVWLSTIARIVIVSCSDSRIFSQELLSAPIELGRQSHS
jgi:hypothetical protein